MARPSGFEPLTHSLEVDGFSFTINGILHNDLGMVCIACTTFGIVQTHPMKTLSTLSDLRPEVTHLEVACTRCDRRGRLSIRRLIAEHGAETSIHAATEGINADCARRDEHALRDRCDVYFPGLAGLLR